MSHITPARAVELWDKTVNALKVGALWGETMHAFAEAAIADYLSQQGAVAVVAEVGNPGFYLIRALPEKQLKRGDELYVVREKP